MSFINMDIRKVYNTPMVGDVVFHTDEPYTECSGMVVEANNGVFLVRWHDGQKETYDTNDHPDIFQ